MPHVRGHIVDKSTPILNTDYLNIESEPFSNQDPNFIAEILVSSRDRSKVSALGSPQSITLHPDIETQSMVNGVFYIIDKIGEEAEAHHHHNSN